MNAFCRNLLRLDKRLPVPVWVWKLAYLVVALQFVLVILAFFLAALIVSFS